MRKQFITLEFDFMKAEWDTETWRVKYTFRGVQGTFSFEKDMEFYADTNKFKMALYLLDECDHEWGQFCNGAYNHLEAIKEG